MKVKTRSIILVGLFAALTAVGAFIKIPIGPAPISLQTIFTMLAGVLLGPYLGALSQLIYVLIGLIGIPIFTSGGGISYIFNPTFGYLLGFIIAPLIIGKIYDKSEKPKFLRTFLGGVLASIAVYIVGVPYMYMILKLVTKTDITFWKAMVTGFIVFIPGDIIKSLVVAFLGNKIAPIVRKNKSTAA